MWGGGEIGRGGPPLGAAYGEALEAAVTVEERRDVPRLFSTYYRSLVGWPEREAVSKFTCPRMVFAGSDDTSYRIGPLVAEHREELEEMGWTVELVDGFKHDLVTRADIVVPMIRQFLDPSLLLIGPEQRCSVDRCPVQPLGRISKRWATRQDGLNSFPGRSLGYLLQRSGEWSQLVRW